MKMQQLLMFVIVFGTMCTIDRAHTQTVVFKAPDFMRKHTVELYVRDEFFKGPRAEARKSAVASFANALRDLGLQVSQKTHVYGTRLHIANNRQKYVIRLCVQSGGQRALGSDFHGLISINPDLTRREAILTTLLHESVHELTFSRQHAPFGLMSATYPGDYRFFDVSSVIKIWNTWGAKTGQVFNSNQGNKRMVAEFVSANQ